MSGEGSGRFGGIPWDQGVVRFGIFSLDPAARQLRRENADIHLTPKAFDLLTLLAAEAPRVVPKTEVHRRLWPDTFVSDATLAGLVKELRKALDDHDRSNPLVRTAHGVGYAFAAQLLRDEDHAIVRDDSHSGSSPIWHWIDVDGRRIRLADGENMIGRDPASRIWLDVASVSRRHARIVVSGPGVTIEDLGSKNRTTLGDTVLDGQTRLRDGDRISIGPIRLVYHSSSHGMPTETHVES